MPTEPPLKLALLGMWHVHADGMLRQIAAHPDEFRLLTAWDPEPTVLADKFAKWASALPEVRFTDSLSDALAAPVDGVVVEGHVYQNPWWACKALEAGRHVLLEKPAGTDLDEFEHLQSLAAERSLHLQMTYLFRYMPAVVELRRRVAAGELGRLYQLRARLPKELALYADYVAHLGRYRGGMFFEMAGHMVDLTVGLLGAPTRVHPVLRHHHAEPGGFVDNAVAVLEYPTALATLEVNSLEVAPLSRRFEFFGTAGAFVIPHLGSGHLRNRDVQPIEFCRVGDADWTRTELPSVPLQLGDLREFAAVAGGRKKPDFAPTHDRTVQELLLRLSGMLPPPEPPGKPLDKPPGKPTGKPSSGPSGKPTPPLGKPPMKPATKPAGKPSHSPKSAARPNRPGKPTR